MTNGNGLDQTICNLPFEVVAIYDNCSQELLQNTNSSLPPSVNVKIRIRNKEDKGTERRGIISVPKLTTKNYPKKVRLVNSAQTIMSFNLALEPNSDEAQKKSNRKLFQMFKPGGCLSIHRDEDGYTYMPSTSNELQRKSASGIEDYESSNITGTFALKKNVFSTSYTDTLKTPKTFLGKCKPGGCLDPPFGEERYTYKPTVQDAQRLQQPITKTNSLHPDINIMDIKPMSTTNDQQINTLPHSYPETEILGKTATLITYPSNLSSSKLRTKDSQNRQASLKMQSEQVELSRKLTNEFPEAYFIPSRKEKPKYDKSYDKYNYEEKEPKVKESYVNKAYKLQSQTPSELLSDALTITSQSFDEPLRGVIEETQFIRDLNTVTPLLLKSEDLLNNITSKNQYNISTSDSTEVIKKDENALLQNQNFPNHNNIPIIKNIFSNITESKNVFDKDNSRLISSIKVNANQETNEDIIYKKNDDPNNKSDSEDKHQSMLNDTNLSKEISTKTSKSFKDQSKTSLDNFEIREEHNILRQLPSVFNSEINKVKKQIVAPSEENNFINPLKDKKSDKLEHEYVKNISGQVISNDVIKDYTTSETNDPKSLTIVLRRDDDENNNFHNNVSEQFKNISESTKSLVQDLEFKQNDQTEELIDDRTERTTEQINDIHPFLVSHLLPKVASLRSLDKQLSLKKSHSFLTAPKNIYVNPKDGLLGIDSSKSMRITNDENNANIRNEKPNKSFDTLENTLSPSLLTGYTSSQKIGMNTIDAGFSQSLESQEKDHEIKLKDNKLSNADVPLIPKILQLNSLSPNKIELDNYNRPKSQGALSITSKIKTSKNTIESIESGTRPTQVMDNFDSFEYNSSNLPRSASKKEATIFYPFSNDSKILLPNQKTDLNISKRDILSDNKFRKPANELTENNIKSLQTFLSTDQSSKKSIDKLESKESPFLSQNVDISSFPELKLKKDHLSIPEKHNFFKVLDKSESDKETPEKKSSHKFDNVHKLKIIDSTPEINKSFTASMKNVNSISSIEINFGFHKFTNEKTGSSIRTFDPSINLANYPKGKIVTIKTTLRKNDSEVKIQIDSETDLTMQLKPTRQMDGSRKLTSNVSNDRRKHNIRVYSSEILINKDKLLQKTLNAMYETLTPIEQILIKLKEEADSLHREQLLLKEVLISKKIKPNKIIPIVRTCSCLQREIGLE